jgi:hypothetical protein
MADHDTLAILDHRESTRHGSIVCEQPIAVQL